VRPHRARASRRQLIFALVGLVLALLVIAAMTLLIMTR
jgi:hypothetical protein